MRVISQKRLREFWANHEDAEDQLRAWYKAVSKARWRAFTDVRADYPKVDRVGHCYVFNIKGNTYRLIVSISYDWTVVLVCTVLTHRQYDENKWKTTCRCEA